MFDTQMSQSSLITPGCFYAALLKDVSQYITIHVRLTSKDKKILE